MDAGSFQVVLLAVEGNCLVQHGHLEAVIHVEVAQVTVHYGLEEAAQ